MILKIAYAFVPIIYPLAVLYWKIFRPKTFGTKVILRYGDEILLVKNTYGTKKWSLPGGGLLRGESPLACSFRETYEEVGVRIKEAQPKGSFEWHGLGKRDTIYVFTAKVANKDFKLQSEEISVAEWFHLSSLPEISSEVLIHSLQLAGLSPVK